MNIHLKSMQEPNTVKMLPHDRVQSEIDPAVLKAAQGMETLFLDQMVKAMRKTVEHSEYSFDNAATEIYQSMLDAEFVEKAVKSGGVGFSELIVDYLESRGYNRKRGQPKGSLPKQSRTGGTDAHPTPAVERKSAVAQAK